MEVKNFNLDNIINDRDFYIRLNHTALLEKIIKCTNLEETQSLFDSRHVKC